MMRKRNRTSTIVSQKNSEIRKLTNENQAIRQRNVMLSKQLHGTRMALTRERKRKFCDSKNVDKPCATQAYFKHRSTSPMNTPTKLAVQDLREEGVSPSTMPRLCQKLAIRHEVERALINVTPPAVVKGIRKSIKFGSGKVRAAVLHVSRTTLYRKNSTRKAFVRECVRKQVVDFYARDDNSTCLPGKRDYVKVKTEKRQKRVNTDFIRNLYLKFKTENNLRISYSAFKKLRPQNVLPVSYMSRQTCLCKQHQNTALLLRAAKRFVADFNTVPDHFIKTYSETTVKEKLTEYLPDDKVITFSTWERVTVSIGQGDKKRDDVKKVKLVEKCLTKSEFIYKFIDEMDDFGKHAFRVRAQFIASKSLKEKLPRGHITCQMDFAENYSCNVKEEIQSAYYSKDQVTVHPAVFHYRADDNEELTTKSVVFVSDVTDHDASMVFAIIKRINIVAKQLAPDTQFIHYLSDSPSSQYRNRHVFRIIADHAQQFQIPCSWTWFESGHGKGPCDGIGGTSKRCADLAVKRYNCIIDNAESFARWGNDSGGKVTYEVITREEYCTANVAIVAINSKAISGSQRYHAAIASGHGRVMFRETSCFCEKCFNALVNHSGEFPTECGWTKIQVVPTVTASGKESRCKRQRKTSRKAAEKFDDRNETEHGGEISNQPQDYSRSSKAGDYILVKFETGSKRILHYVAQILDIDDDDYEVKWLKRSNKRDSFIPDTCNISSVAQPDVVARLPQPSMVGAAKRSSFKFDFDFSSYVLG